MLYLLHINTLFMNTTEIKFPVPLNLRKGTLKKDQIAAMQSAIDGFDFIKKATNAGDDKDIDLLDYGCGVKYTQAFLQNGIPIKNYTGVDVDKKMISFLKNNVSDERFIYSVLPFHNEMYNKEGIPMTPNADLGVGDKHFDLIIALSVFTHLIPRDSKVLLKIMRRYLKPNGKIFFTTFINDTLQKEFRDFHKDKPLLRAVYTSSFWETAAKDADLKIVEILEKNDVFKTKKQYIMSL